MFACLKALRPGLIAVCCATVWPSFAQILNEVVVTAARIEQPFGNCAFGIVFTQAFIDLIAHWHSPCQICQSFEYFGLAGTAFSPF